MAADVKSLHAARHLPRRLRTLARHRHAHHLGQGARVIEDSRRLRVV